MAYQMALNRQRHGIAPQPGDAEALAGGPVANVDTSTGSAGVVPQQPAPEQPVVPSPDQPTPDQGGPPQDGQWAGHQQAAWDRLSAIDPNVLWAYEQGQGQGQNRFGNYEYNALMQYLPPRIKAQIPQMGLGGAMARYLQYLRGLGYGGGMQNQQG
jgi:hypothetical protein